MRLGYSGLVPMFRIEFRPCGKLIKDYSMANIAKGFRVSVITLCMAALLAAGGCANNPLNNTDQVNENLRQNPISCRNNVTKSLTYLRDSNLYNIQSLKIAAAGLDISTMHCPANSSLYMYLGLANYRLGDYFNAEDNFERAILISNYKNRNAIYMYGYVYSLIDNNDYDNLVLKDLMQNYNSQKIQSILLTTAKHLRYLKQQQDSAENSKMLNRKQLMISTAFVLDESQQNSKNGMNLLDGLTLQLSGSQEWQNFGMSEWGKYADVVNNANISSGSFASAPFNSLGAATISIPQITYDLNIFNHSGDDEKVLSQPMLLASYGSQSKYFSGLGFLLGLTGSGGSSASFQQEDIGIGLTVTPTLVDQNTVQLVVTVTRDFIRGSAPSSVTFENVVPTDDNTLTTTLNIPFGQTAVLSSLSSNELSNTSSKVPLLGDMPILGKFFNTQEKRNFNKNIIIFLTPVPYYISTNVRNNAAFIEENNNFRALLQDLSRGREPINFVADLNNFSRFPDYVSNNIVGGLMQKSSMLALLNQLPE
jgi:tetratricopeptide (TPR) repeat protein